jgi:hypothetical protein
VKGLSSSPPPLRRLIAAASVLALATTAACAASSPPVTMSPASLHTHAAYVLKVHGTLADVDGHTVARIDPFQTPHQPRAGAPVELHLDSFPAEGLEAVLSGVTPNDAFTVRAEANLLHPDSRFAAGTPFVGQIVVESAEPGEGPASETASQ